MAERSVHKGPCVDCGRPMVDQREWNRNLRIRPGRVKASGLGRCQACYARGRRHGTLPSVTITARYPVHCAQCGPVGGGVDRAEANRIRVEHLATHGIQVVAQRSSNGEPVVARRLSDAELARLRRAVGLAS